MSNQKRPSHLQEMNESYLVHLRHASFFSFKMIGAGLVGLVHAVCPNIFVTAVSTAVNELHNALIKRGRV